MNLSKLLNPADTVCFHSLCAENTVLQKKITFFYLV